MVTGRRQGRYCKMRVFQKKWRKKLLANQNQTCFLLLHRGRGGFKLMVALSGSAFKQMTRKCGNVEPVWLSCHSIRIQKWQCGKNILIECV